MNYEGKSLIVKMDLSAYRGERVREVATGNLRYVLERVEAGINYGRLKDGNGKTNGFWQLVED